MTDQTLLTQVPFNAYPWQAGHLYNPGDIVTPTTAPSAGAVSITNADFTSSITGWSGTGFTWSSGAGYNGNGYAQLASGNSSTLLSAQQVAVTAGQSVTASCFLGGSTNAIGNSQTTGNVALWWYDSTHTLLATNPITNGTVVNAGQLITPVWTQSTVTGIAPPGAVFMAVAVTCANTSTTTMGVDAFSWNYQAPSVNSSASTAPQYFTSVAATALTSGLTEPDWTNGGTNTGNVTDNGITWSRGVQSVIYWQGQALCFSAGSEPSWPIGQGKMVTDGISGNYSIPFHWQAQTPQIQDTNCPQTSTAVAIGASHIFAGNKDIVNYSAVTNCLDWTSTADAGFLPTGLQNYGSNSVSALGIYRSNLVVFNSQAFQIWQIDEDPANMNLLDSVAIGCSYPKTVTPVNTDLFWLASQGVRSMSISGGSGNTQAGDIGMPIDSLVQLGTAYCVANGTEPLSEYLPSLGQYFIHFPGWQAAGLFKTTPANTSNVFVYSMTRTGQVGAWSRYNYPFPTIDAFCIAGDSMYLRSGDDILKVDTTALYDYANDNYNSTSRQVAFQGVVQWPWLDCDSPGVTKQFHTIDVVSSQSTTLTIEIGYDQTNTTTAYTTPFTIPGDSVPGLQIPIPLMAPSFSPRLTMTSTDNWSIKAVNLLVSDMNVNA